LKTSCNQYPWGKTGKDSIAARLCEKQPGWDGDGPKQEFKLDDSKPYAEQWFGTYPDLPSYVASTGEDLQDNSSARKLSKKFGHTKLPYLPKVLSIAKALPLQLHPNKEVAAKLHKENPNDFTDPNHKPEIALALGKFEAFCGFKPLEDIASLLKLEPLQQFLPSRDIKPSDFTDQQLKQVVKSMLQASDSTVKQVYKSLTSLPKDSFGKYDQIPKLAPRLAEQYSSSDPGILVALMTMNYLVLEAGEAIYIPADGIHAYLSGDIIECMARSNNVLNTGFCPRAERSNIDLFCDCLTFTPHKAEDAILEPQRYAKGREGKTQLFAPPLSEFDMLQTKLERGEKEVLEKIGGGPSMAIVTKGGASVRVNGEGWGEIREGQVLFIARGVEIGLEASGQEGLLLHTAVVEGSTK
ncbi:Mannose-6-phosphate isomerase, partial [Pseudocercospora fuligena]